MHEAVVFVHGIWMTGLELALLRKRVQACGYDTYQFHYHSLLRPPAVNAACLDAYLRKLDADVIHLIGHSLGGIVLDNLFDRFPQQRPGRVLMLGSPLLGSVVARVLDRRSWTRWLIGRAGARGLLGDAPRWPGTRRLGMIAGNRGAGIGLLVAGSDLVPPHDGTVRLAETEAAGVDRHLTVPHGHFGMLFDASVAEAVCRYLKTGEFDGDL